MGREQLPQRPLPKHARHVFSVNAPAQVFQCLLNFPEQLLALLQVPLDVNPSPFKLQAAVCRIRSHPQVG